MSRHRTSIASRLKSTERFRTQPVRQEMVLPQESGLIRILVLDHERETLERLENALWIWPHKVANADSVDEAIEMCRHLRPTALIADNEYAGRYTSNVITTLRKHLPQVPIIAIGSRLDKEASGSVLDQGADAFLPREELHRPTLHDLLRRIQRIPDTGNVLDFPFVPEMPLPWRDSGLVGALICDIAGTITDANDCIARWLEYANASELVGKSVSSDILDSQADWAAWKKIAGDMSALLRQSATVKSKNQQLLWMKLEVFAAPNAPSHLQAVFVDQTELALLTGRTSDT